MESVDEKAYSKREEDAFRDFVRTNLADIKVQTTKTNGSVRELQIWRARIIGAIAALTFLIASVAIPLILIYFKIAP